MAGRGTGVPNWFMCWREHREHYKSRARDRHRVVRTGRERPYNTRNHPPRSTNVQREYECSCGHVGWSNHVDLIDYPLKGSA